VNFSERPPSKQWAALKFKGKKFAEVWFKPEGEPLGLRFRIPQNSFQVPDIRERLTLENLLNTVVIPPEEVESWRHGDVTHSDLNRSNPELKDFLPEPPPDVAHLEVYVRLKSPPQVVAPHESREPETPSAKCQDLEARWNAILGVEAGIEGLRLRMDGVRLELESAWNKTLTPEERLHALKADVAQWTKAKTRVHYALPKVKEFVHRATWVMGAPERKKLEELFKNYIEPNIPFPQMDRVPEQLESLLKDRQILSAQGVAVHHECKTIAAEIQGALTRLQNNAAVRANKQRNAKRAKGKFFKDVRRLTGAD
jgi:hypothetical protein